MITSKFITVVLFIGFTNLSELKSANYYVSSSDGNDENTQQQATQTQTPWKSLAKINSYFGSLKPGDSVLLKRGDVFEGSLVLSSSGTNQSKIVVSSYGEGHSPVISGWKKIKKWTKHEKPGIWSSELDRNTLLNLVSIENKIKEKGRYPNNAFVNYNVNENGLIELPSHINPKAWESATFVIRKNQWIIDKVSPLEYRADGIRLENNMRYPPKSGYGLFIQDHINTLDEDGEWYFDDKTSNFYIFLAEGQPGSKDIKIGSQENLLTNQGGVQHVKIQNLCFSGANKDAISLEKAFNIEISNCTIEYAGENAVYAVDVPNLKFVNNNVVTALNSGVFFRYGTPNSIIADNNITDIHPFFGMGKSGDGNGVGIHSISDFSVIANNRLSNIGYSGIMFNGIQTIVERNHINNYCLVKNDGGGIYTYQGANKKLNFGRIIKENIIENGIGTTSGTTMSKNISIPQVEGIYLDDNASGIMVEGNTVNNSRRNGIHIHNGRNIQIIRNKVANCYIQLALSDDDLGDRIENIRIEENQFAAFSDHQNLVSIASNIDNHATMANFGNNTYITPENQKLFYLIQKQQPDRSYETSFMNLRMIEAFGIKEESPIRIVLPSSTQTKYNLSNQQGDAKKISLSTFKIFNDGSEISSIESQIKIQFKKPFGAVAVGFPQISDDNLYQLSFNANTEQTQILHLFLRLDGRPWSNLSLTQPVMLSPLQTEYTVNLGKTENADRILLLIFSQDSSKDIGLSNLQVTAHRVDEAAHQALLFHNPTDSEILLTDPSKIVIPAEGTDRSLVLKPFQSILLYK
ncbi:right-handed parallel beta-helix repeat-containing protein [Lunatibacter salilacus]|uniref:right-handed parallel beta-helix repeat-containing protein n=1 Tax=Lunatibacter salilacus TaxID=2483804 RepID=UPI00131B5A9B|nr:right-handed parallel beta-helix repeat-containing protein [Lunatibacter salilacus]